MPLERMSTPNYCSALHASGMSCRLQQAGQPSVCQPILAGRGVICSLVIAMLFAWE